MAAKCMQIFMSVWALLLFVSVPCFFVLVLLRASLIADRDDATKRLWLARTERGIGISLGVFVGCVVVAVANRILTARSHTQDDENWESLE